MTAATAALGRGIARLARAPRRHLSVKYALLVAILTGGVVLAGGLLELYFSYRQDQDAIVTLEQEKAAGAAVRIQDYLAQIERSVLDSTRVPLITTDQPTFEEQLSPNFTGPQPLVPLVEQRRRDFNRLLAQEPAIAEIRYLGAGGEEVLFVSRLELTRVGSGIDHKAEDRFWRARLGSTYFGPVYFRNETEPYMTISVSCACETDTGVTAAEVNLKLILGVISQIQIGRHGKAYIVDGTGKLVADPDIGLVLRQPDLSRLRQVQAAKLAATANRTTRSGAIAASDLQGRAVLSAYAPVSGPGWFVFVEEPQSDAFASLNNVLYRTIAFVFAALVVAVLASLFLARRLAAPIRALQFGAARIGAGELDHRIVVHTGDELEVLAGEFNHMTARLRESYADLEERVAARTRDLSDALARLEVADRAKSEFLSRMSHELRTPLNAIIGFSEIMLMDPNLGARQQDWAQHVLRAGRHLLDLINEVLDFARIETGRLSLSIEPVALEPVLREVDELMQPMAGAAGAELAVSSAGDLVVLADRQRLKQVLLNLLGNAVKYNVADGSVRVAAEPRAEGSVRILVEDTGPGIAPEDLGRLFVAFDRLGAEQSSIEGSGLGLAIAKRLVEAMNGTLDVESAPGRGSTFWVDLPASAATPLPVSLPDLPEPEGITATGSTARVLYVEDNPSNREVVAELLALRGSAGLITAVDGSMGLALARAEQPDLILLDLNLPDLHGDEVLRRLKQDSRTSAIPVVVLSADATPRQIARLLEHGAQEYLTKPLDVRRLGAILDELEETGVAGHGVALS